MNKSESKYFNTAILMDRAFLELLDTKDFAYITVKEICERAGVNRSTFYLHYESIGDLLEESIAYMSRQFDSYFSEERCPDVSTIESASLSELFLITPRYLTPYLQYIKDHRRLFKTAVEKAEVLGSQSKFDALFRQVIGPIMSRYHIPEEQRQFMLSYYIHGIMGVIRTWIAGDCRESVEFIMEIIISCIKRPVCTSEYFE